MNTWPYGINRRASTGSGARPIHGGLIAWRRCNSHWAAYVGPFSATGTSRSVLRVGICKHEESLRSRSQHCWERVRVVRWRRMLVQAAGGLTLRLCVHDPIHRIFAKDGLSLDTEHRIAQREWDGMPTVAAPNVWQGLRLPFADTVLCRAPVTWFPRSGEPRERRTAN